MALKEVSVNDPDRSASRAVWISVIVVLLLLFLFFLNPAKVIPAGHVGVKDFFGVVSPNGLSPGVHLVIPMTRVVVMSIQTQELKETAEVPSQEGLIMDLEASLLFRLDPEKAPDMYKTVGRDYESVAVEPQFRSAIREITASYDAKALYSSEREKVAHEILGSSRS